MIDIKVYNQGGQQIDTIGVDEGLLGGKVSADLLRQALIMYESNRRVGLANTKGVGDVSASNRKMYRQKGTGRARAGQRRSSIRVGGGVAHGPHPKSWRQKMPVKARRRALMSALLGKMVDGEVIVLDQLELQQPKTREVASIIKNLEIPGKFLLVTAHYDNILVRCTRNIDGSNISDVESLNAWIVVAPKRVIFLRDALEKLLRQLRDWQDQRMRGRARKGAVAPTESLDHRAAARPENRATGRDAL